MIINVVAVKRKYAREYARELEIAMQKNGELVSFMSKGDCTDGAMFETLCANILKYGQASLIVTNVMQPMHINGEAVLPDLNVILLNQYDPEQVAAAKEIKKSLEATYQALEQDACISEMNVYSKLGIPTQSEPTITRISSRVRSLKQTI